MSLSIGIVGLPNVGKSTLFNALTKNKVAASNYPFCTIDPNVGVVPVPDNRLNELAKIYNPEKIIPTTIEFVDIAGLVSGAHKGEGLGNRFLSHIRETDAICEVIRNFEDKNITHVSGKINPREDEETISLELVMADLATVAKRLEKVSKDAKSGDQETVDFKHFLERLHEHLNQNQPAREFAISDEEQGFMKSLQLLTRKPIIYVVNNNDSSAEFSDGLGSEMVNLNIKQEAEIASLPEEEQVEYIKELNLSDSGLNKLIKSSYRLLNLITFLTGGPKEVRAWTTLAGSKAPQAAGVIHSDFETGFIRVEVIGYEALIKVGSEQAAREQGLMRTEGKDYVVQDGDVCHFLFNN